MNAADIDEELYDQGDEMMEEGYFSNEKKLERLNYSKLEKLKKGEKPLETVIGHEAQKKEILLVIDWFKRSKEFKEKGVSVPKGLILFGPPGNGKSLIIREIIRYVDVPVFIFNGEENNIVKGIVDTFKKARAAGKSIVVIDELDLLIDADRRVTRALQENLDGVEENDDILVLTATNSLHEIPKPLLREGRFEKRIRIAKPDEKEVLSMLKKYFSEFNIKFPNDIDEEDVGLLLMGMSCVGVKSVVNDIVLRNGFENITSEMIEDSILNIQNKIKEKPAVDNLQVAIHEAGHACMSYAFTNYFKIGRLSISGADGEFVAKEIEENFWSYEKVIANIQISMAGNIAEKVIFGTGCRGCEEDLQRARASAYNLINMCGYSSCSETLPSVQNDCAREETEIKRRKNEIKIERLLRKSERETYKYVRKNKDVIKKLGKLLYQKKNLRSSEILKVLNQNG